MTVLRKRFYIHWSAGRSPRVHEVNPGRDPSMLVVGVVNKETPRDDSDNVFEYNELDTTSKLARRKIIRTLYN